VPSQPPTAPAAAAVAVSDPKRAAKTLLGPSLGLLRHGVGNVPSPALSLAGVLAVDFYLECMLKGGSIPGNFSSGADKLRAQLAFNLFNAFPLPDERKLLLPRPAGAEEGTPSAVEADRKRLGHRLEGFVGAYLSRCDTDHELALPRGLSSSKQLLVGTIESRLYDLKTKGFEKTIDPDELARFRASLSNSPAPLLQLPRELTVPSVGQGHIEHSPPRKRKATSEIASQTGAQGSPSQVPERKIRQFFLSPSPLPSAAAIR